MGLHYVGMGVSGGEEGALNGPSLMPGGPRAAYDHLAPILTKIAAQTDDDGACVTYIGEGGGGHYVKMVHNGIEYGDMQLIAEVYELLRRLEGRTAPEIGAVFAQWNETELQSYLVEITATVLRYTDPETRQPLVDLILDTSGQKGTGRWTSQDALDLGVPIPTIDAAVWSRNISARKDERVRAAQVLGAPADGRNGGRWRRLHGAGAGGALRGEDHHLRPGDEAAPRGLARVRLRPEPRGGGPHLEGRVHHPRGPAGPDQGRLPRRRPT